MPTPSSLCYVTTVPVYKAKPSQTEAFSLLQLRILGVQNVTLVCPEGLDLAAYLDLWPELQVQRYAPEHFVSVQSYNNLVISPAFYTPLIHYDYLLIYQLDAFLLSNQVLEFCNEGYDYYGAPWIKGFPQYRFLFNRWPIQINGKRFHVGNGGLSLRKIDSTLNLLKRKASHISKTFFMEDAFFGYWGSLDPDFHACPPLVAARFSLEMEPSHWMEQTGVLPMGMHGFEVWHKDFYNALLQESYQKLRDTYPQLNNQLNN
ncbi:hypothetical protein AOC21_01595 [Polynucleobacter sp. VK25]|uniref:DUF5672 family protein n=1 Tax=Polynucleobacter sp. VK25 TaxID=1758398 RepID=UPI001BFE6EBB|nr:DUF5672 family protein [Polynucleobacter sp. VK25]QWD68632.1 hypothetical protein AOC21_01595 [Polynucleobacter sp. VK25]